MFTAMWNYLTSSYWVVISCLAILFIGFVVHPVLGCVAIVAILAWAYINSDDDPENDVYNYTSDDSEGGKLPPV